MCGIGAGWVVSTRVQEKDGALWTALKERRGAKKTKTKHGETHSHSD